MTIFRQKVLDVVRTISRGTTLSYKEVAARSGHIGAARAVGSILNLKQNYNPQIPCHRVIRSNGDVGKYNRGRSHKIKKLQFEGYLVAR